MNFKILSKINEVSNFQSSCDLFIQNDTLKSFKGNVFFLQNYVPKRIYDFNKVNILLNSLNTPLIINKEGLTEQIIDFYQIISIYYPYLVFYLKGEPRIYGIYDFIESKVLFETTEWIGRDIIGEYVFDEQKQSIICRTTYSSAILWQYDIDHLGKYINLSNEELPYEVRHFIGSYQNKLIVQLSNAAVLVLDINTGNLINIIFLHKEIVLPQGLFWDDGIPMHLVDHNLIWLNNQSLIHIDLDTYMVKNIRSYFEEPREQQFRFMSNIYKDGKIYFVADYGWQYVTPSNVGVMNAESGEVLWYTQLKKTGGLAEPPQVEGGKLYIRTNNSELYIFEEEVNNEVK